MSNGDSFELLLNQLLKDVRVISENLELIGLFYVGKFTLKSLWCVSKAIYSFVLPRLVSNDGWIKSHGKWAIVNGLILTRVDFKLLNRLINLFI
jgi:hypothetical protein